MSSSGDAARKVRRGYRPAVEGLEALRLFHAAAPHLADVSADLFPVDASAPLPLDSGLDHDRDHDLAPSAGDTRAWDAVLEQRVADLLAPTGPALVVSDPAAFRSGLGQLDRYLGRAWARAGLPPHKADDCTQAVYLSLIESLGRRGFDRLVSEVGDLGIREVLSRETPEGPIFFRAIDAVKKRAQREHAHASLDDAAFDPPASAGPSDLARTLDEAIAHALNPRETDLIRSTLAGESPSEIAERWGVAAKTVSNEKTRALSKLREFLVCDSPSPASPVSAAEAFAAE